MSLFFLLLNFKPSDFDKSDEFCPRCDNHFVLPARTLDSEYTHYEPKIDPRVDTSHLFDKRIKQPSLEEQLKDFDFFRTPRLKFK
ncbi:hypothetical protein DSO57_1020154 [Entomophthora muscae]|uniref:Uncharacterized protein n=1 Tax=Entomophthora muscae TaxID=34485 RepID=A0ACC2RIR2_9FUNG|nr:hypothetical protein DSO57_1020154 [Entomophthora muscae]